MRRRLLQQNWHRPDAQSAIAEDESQVEPAQEDSQKADAEQDVSVDAGTEESTSIDATEDRVADTYIIEDNLPAVMAEPNAVYSKDVKLAANQGQTLPGEATVLMMVTPVAKDVAHGCLCAEPFHCEGRQQY